MCENVERFPNLRLKQSFAKIGQQPPGGAADGPDQESHHSVQICPNEQLPAAICKSSMQKSLGEIRPEPTTLARLSLLSVCYRTGWEFMYFQIVRSTENPFPVLNFLELQMLLLLLPKQSRLKRFSSRRNFIFRFVTLRFSITCAALVGDGRWFGNWPLFALELNLAGDDDALGKVKHFLPFCG